MHRVTLLGLGAMTHCFDQNQRFIELFAGESTGGKVSLEGPIDASAAPPGDYLLFLLRRVHSGESTHEVPSVAAIVRVLAGSG